MLFLKEVTWHRNLPFQLSESHPITLMRTLGDRGQMLGQWTEAQKEGNWLTGMNLNPDSATNHMLAYLPLNLKVRICEMGTK